MRNRMLLFSAALILTACASGAPRTPAPMLTPPETDMQPCQALQQPVSGQINDLLSNHIAVAKAYHQCRDRHQGLINWLEKTDDALRQRP